MAASIRVTSKGSSKEGKDQYLTHIGMVSYCKKRSKKADNAASSKDGKLKAVISKA